MKNTISFLLICFVIFESFTNCKKDSTVTNVNELSGDKLKIKIGTKIYNATLYSNKTTEALKAMLPLNLAMKDLNSNEKKFDLPVSLPTNIEEIGTIHEGDILLWGNNTIVLFYKKFNTTYRYTKIGKIDDASGLAAALGSGDIKVSFELEKD
ncbi:MAG: cyclophilin-like fold protein [Bacteroidota bacterium]